MTKLSDVQAAAQKQANRERRTLVIYNLNPCSPLYVVRDYPEKAPSREAVEKLRDFVQFVDPA